MTQPRLADSRPTRPALRVAGPAEASGAPVAVWAERLSSLPGHASLVRLQQPATPALRARILSELRAGRHR